MLTEIEKGTVRTKRDWHIDHLIHSGAMLIGDALAVSNITNYTTPILTKDTNGSRVLFFDAKGIPKDCIQYETEFINKTKQIYLNIKGENFMSIGFENSIDVHYLIDTNIYDGYRVIIQNGLVIVELYEIENEKPVLRNYGEISEDK